MSHHEWFGNSKADAMARSGASRYGVAPGDVHAHGAAWDKAVDLAHFLSEAGLYICSSGEWPSVSKCADADGGLESVAFLRPQLQVTFHEIVWAVDRWRCTRFQRYARNGSTLAALRRMACIPLTGAARGAAPLFPRAHESHKLRRSGPITWCTLCGAYSSNRSFALRQSCPGKCPSDTRLQRLRQLVLVRHPITGIWMLEEEPPADVKCCCWRLPVAMQTFALLCWPLDLVLAELKEPLCHVGLRRRIRRNGMSCSDETGTLTQNIMTIVSKLPWCAISKYSCCCSLCWLRMDAECDGCQLLMFSSVRDSAGGFNRHTSLDKTLSIRL